MSLPTNIEKETRQYPKAVCTGFGRVFYGAQGRVYFSPVITDNFEALGRCYQQNDPTAEDQTDVLATDGGEIPIPELGELYHIEAFKTGIIVFGENGIWFIRGTSDTGFTAVSYIVDKISDLRLHSKRSVSFVEDALVFCTSSGLYRADLAQNLSIAISPMTELRIDSYMKDFITENVVSSYDKEARRLYLSDSGMLGKILVYDVRLDSFYPWKVTIPGLSSATGVEGVTYDTHQRKIVFGLGRSFNTSFKGCSLLELKDTKKDFFDANFPSYIQSQETQLSTFSRKKTIPFLQVYMERTETRAIDYLNNAFLFDKPSSCLLSLTFGYSNTLSAQRQIYKVMRGNELLSFFPYPLGDFPYVVEFKDKIRGVGNSVKFRFTSEADKEMNLLGYAVQFSTNTRG